MERSMVEVVDIEVSGGVELMLTMRLDLPRSVGLRIG